MISRISGSIDRPRGHRRFAPGWPLWLFTLTFLPLLLSLGVWQLDRAGQKRALEAQMEQQRERPASPLHDLSATTPLAWRALRLTGQFDPQHIWLLDNRTRNGQAGVEVLQLFHDQPSNRQLILNRGWLAWPDRRHLPAVPVAEGILRLQAEALPPPGPGFRLASASTAGWPRLITYAPAAVLAEHAGLAAEPLMARLQPGSPGALRLEWPAMPMPATKHTAYAVQWFTLALALLILFIWAGYRPAHRENNTHDEHD